MILRELHTFPAKKVNNNGLAVNAQHRHHLRKTALIAFGIFVLTFFTVLRLTANPPMGNAEPNPADHTPQSFTVIPVTAPLTVSRDSYSSTDPAVLAAARKAEADAAAAALEATKTPDAVKALAQDLASTQFGWGADQFSCLNSLWTKESGWNYKANNPESGAYGIPQSLPGSKMATIAPDWQDNPQTQIIWGLTYIKNSSYGSPCAAWAHSQAVNWY